MKKLLVIAALSGIFMTSCKEQKQEVKTDTFKYSISMDVANLRGPVILLDRTTNEPIKTIYSRTPEFKIEGELPLNKMHASYVLHFPSKYSNPYMYPVAEACAIDFYMDKITTIKAHYDSLLFSNVENEHMNKVEQFKQANFPAVVEFNKFNKQSLKESSGERRSHEEQIAYANKGNALLDAVRKELIDKTGQFANSEEMAVVLASWGGQVGVEKLDSLGALFQPAVKETAAYERLVTVLDYMKKQTAPKSLSVGEKAPAFTLKDAAGNEHSLSDFKGKYLVIDFWASWCGPCKKEMPFMKELHKKYHSKGLEMLAISTDQDPNAWKMAMKKLNMPYLQLHDKNGEVAPSYFVRGIPYVLLIGPNGNILAIERGEVLEESIKENLKL
ncbi:TlpA disulfide reductase family protein [Marinifilum fragile]|uniref:TlpA family protein disulfide reductase n=1 Tax=Marinifilum fragile TaxID=570161 RepID=UPI002AA761AE|nr:TlpA disulfide reductase family protein [Marinifilum fragile]